MEIIFIELCLSSGLYSTLFRTLVLFFFSSLRILFLLLFKQTGIRLHAINKDQTSLRREGFFYRSSSVYPFLIYSVIHSTSVSFVLSSIFLSLHSVIFIFCVSSILIFTLSLFLSLITPFYYFFAQYWIQLLYYIENMSYCLVYIIVLLLKNCLIRFKRSICFSLD